MRTPNGSDGTGPVDIAVVGAGITGMLAALELARDGARVELLDAGEPSGTDSNAGSLHVQLQSRLLHLFPELMPKVEAALPLYLQAVRAWEDLDRELGGVELVKEGGLMVAEDEAQLAFLHRKAERERRQGVDVDILDRAALDRIAPWLGPRVMGAELCRDEGKVNPLMANAKIRRLVHEAGVPIRRARVAALEPDRGTLRLESGRTRKAERILVAAGWGTEALAGSVGVNVPARFEALHMNVTEPCRPRIRHLIQHASTPITFKQFSAGQIVVGGGWPADWTPGDGVPQILERSLVGNLALAGRIVPAIRSLRILRSWAGLHTVSDGGTVLGALPGHDRVMVAVPGDAGYTLGPLLGRAAADLLLGRDPPFDIEPCSPERFRSSPDGSPCA